jgi:ubiquinone/menaquinone biosynthesis C-methylase UbiE
MKILDAACGYGRASDFFTPDVDYIGIDLSSTLITEARLLYPNRSFLHCNIDQTPFLDKYFDWAIAISLKEMVIRECGQNDWDLMEKELRRVAKNVMFLEYTQGNNNEICTIL